jgi:DegV family protein with EDD domain
MRRIKIVADSSADILKLQTLPFAVAPLKIIADEKEFVDDSALDANDMVSWFDTYKGKAKTSCPNPSDWLDAFEDYDEIFCVTITSGLSGSYNAACAAKGMYESEHDGKRVYVINSLSAGPELALIIEKLEEYIGQDMPFDEICREIEAYKETTGLVFMLESLKNLAANGRVSPAIAKIAGVLGIRVVGKASLQGTLEPIHKCRGEAKALTAILSHMEEAGLAEGKVRIAHCQNEAAAQTLAKMIAAKLPKAEIRIHPCRGLCSYYAEKGGMLVGFEKN